MANVRTNTELVAQLTPFTARRSQDFPAWAIVTCPREDCGETFLVKMVSWLKQRTGISGTVLKTRPCPYCFKAATLPSRSAIR